MLVVDLGNGMVILLSLVLVLLLCCFPFFFLVVLRVEFLLKTESGYLRDAEVT